MRSLAPIIISLSTGLLLSCNSDTAPNTGAAAVASAGSAGTSSVSVAPAGTGGAATPGASTGGAAGRVTTAPAGASAAGAAGSVTLAAGSGGVGAAGTSAAAAGAAGASTAGGSGTVAAIGGSGSAGQTGADPALPATGTFPAIMDPWQTGPFGVAMMAGVGPSRNATVLYPRDLGKDGLKHPIVVWDNGAGQTGLSIYGSLLQHLASHGFAVYAANSATDGGKELTDGLDWMTAQASDSKSPFFEKLDTTKTAAMGHSQGSIATFAIAGDPRLTTTIHLSGGTNPDIAEGHATLPNLHNPAAFICGEEPGPGADGLVSGDTASPWCAYDFEHAAVPVFLAQIQGASHISAPGMTLGACAAWLRWRLMGDTTMATNFVGPDCALCKRRNWMCKEKDLM